MRLPVFVHQLSTSYGESALPFDDTRNPFSEIWGKTNDGLSFQGTFDPGIGARPGFQGVADAAAYEAEGEREGGREWKPWGVVHGRFPGYGDEYGEAEADLAAHLAIAGAGAGEKRVYIVDVEPYYHGGARPQFWRNDLGANADTVFRFCNKFLEVAGVDGEIWIAFDARAAHLAPIAFDAWARHPAVKLFLPQVYSGDFIDPARPQLAAEVNADADLEYAVQLIEGYRIERGRIGPILQANLAPDVLRYSILKCHDLGTLPPSLWQRMNLSQENADVIAALANPWGAATPPAPLPEPSTEIPGSAIDIARARALQSEISAKVAELGGVLEGKA